MAREESLGTPKEVAGYLKVPENTLTMWRHRRTGPQFIKVGGKHVRYRWADVEDWLRKQSVPA